MTGLKTLTNWFQKPGKKPLQSMSPGEQTVLSSLSLSVSSGKSYL